MIEPMNVIKKYFLLPSFLTSYNVQHKGNTRGIVNAHCRIHFYPFPEGNEMLTVSSNSSPTDKISALIVKALERFFS